MTEQAPKTESVEETVETPDGEQKPPEKTVTQSELNRILAKERKDASTKYNALKAEHDALLKKIEDERTAAEDAAKEKVEELRKDLPENILKLLDRLSPIDQLEWLNDPANKVQKKTIPELPEGSREQLPRPPKLRRVV